MPLPARSNIGAYTEQYLIRPPAFEASMSSVYRAGILALHGTRFAPTPRHEPWSLRRATGSARGSNAKRKIPELVRSMTLGFCGAHPWGGTSTYDAYSYANVGLLDRGTGRKSSLDLSH